jgi:hypothetical protein
MFTNGCIHLFTSVVSRSVSSPALEGVQTYVDLGSGIGSTLLIVAHWLRSSLVRDEQTIQPIQALAVEAQAQSVALLKRTLEELPPCTSGKEPSWHLYRK